MELADEMRAVRKPQRRPSNIHTDVFVFGSNLAGRHGAGAARFALEHFGAQPGEGVGRIGASYAIPTKDSSVITMRLDQIRPHVEVFLDYAWNHPNETFYVTALGTGLAGYSHADIAPMFRGAPSNCLMPDEWEVFLR